MAAPLRNGFLNIYKEESWTSMDVCARLRSLLHIKRVGHAGTLDPAASGVLPVAIGKATKDINLLSGEKKTYEAVLLLGLKTDTLDITGRVTESLSEGDPRLGELTKEEITEAIYSFKGEIEQLTPMYSARKVNGKRLYEYARKGEKVERKTKKVTIYDIEITNIDLPRIRMKVTCSGGTYIRTLCDDIGDKLGTFGTMEKLTRLSYGDFNIENALKISEIEDIIKRGDIDRYLRLLKPTALSIGKFDGTHVGHKELIRVLKEYASCKQLKTAVVILNFGSKELATGTERKEKLYRLGVDYVFEIPFTREIMELSAESFLRDILINKYNMRAIVAGKDITFGKGCEGNAHYLEENAKRIGIEYKLIDKLQIALNNDEEDISSTLLKKELIKGDMLHVTRLLGEAFSLSGKVTRGRHLGTDIMGYPTMNIKVDKDRVLPPYGVYAVSFILRKKEGESLKSLRGIANLGVKPTVSTEGGDTFLEVFSFVDVGETYDMELSVSLEYFIRPERKFASLEELKESIRNEDIPRAREYFEENAG